MEHVLVRPRQHAPALLHTPSSSLTFIHCDPVTEAVTLTAASHSREQASFVVTSVVHGQRVTSESTLIRRPGRTAGLGAGSCCCCCCGCPLASELCLCLPPKKALTRPLRTGRSLMPARSKPRPTFGLSLVQYACAVGATSASSCSGMSKGTLNIEHKVNTTLLCSQLTALPIQEGLVTSMAAAPCLMQKRSRQILHSGVLLQSLRSAPAVWRQSAPLLRPIHSS